MRPVSRKRAKVLYKEKKLTNELMKRCGGLCEICGNLPDWRGLAKHERIKRSQGGDPTERNNCLMVCGKCHARCHGIKEKSGE